LAHDDITNQRENYDMIPVSEIAKKWPSLFKQKKSASKEMLSIEDDNDDIIADIK